MWFSWVHFQSQLPKLQRQEACIPFWSLRWIHEAHSGCWPKSVLCSFRTVVCFLAGCGRNCCHFLGSPTFLSSKLPPSPKQQQDEFFSFVSQLFCSYFEKVLCCERLVRLDWALLVNQANFPAIR